MAEVAWPAVSDPGEDGPKHARGDRARGEPSARRSGSAGGGTGGSQSPQRRRPRRRRGGSSSRPGAGAQARAADRGGSVGAQRSRTPTAASDPAGSRTATATGPPAASGSVERWPGRAAAEPFELAPEEIAANRRRGVLLAVIDGALLGLVLGIVLGVAVGPLVGAVCGVLVLVVAWLALTRGALRFDLLLIGARPAGERCARLATLVEGLCATFGLRPPDLKVIDDPVPNACALGRDGGHGVLVVTSGLLQALDLIEMEGVVAHELVHLKRHDARVTSVAIAAVAPLTWLTGSDRLLRAAVGSGREYRADQVAVVTVRYPPGLRDALVAMASAAPPGAGSIFGGRRLAMTRWAWIDSAVGRRDELGLPGIDNTTVRIDALAEW